MRESSTYQFILREGRAEGENDGLIKGLRLSLTMVLEQKFGSIPPEIAAKIQATTDSARLEQALRQFVTLAAITDLVL